MILFSGALGLVALAVWIFCIVDTITTPADQVRNLPKLAWIFIVVLLVDIGSIAWLVAGRRWGDRTLVGVGARRTAPARPTNPDDDDEFLAGLKARADEQRRRGRDAAGDDPSDGNAPPA